MTVSTYDGATGKGETKQYSKYYDAGDWIIKGKLGVSVVVDHEKKNIPVLHGLQQAFGAFGPGDLEATGKVTIYLWNVSNTKHSIVFRKITSGNYNLELSTSPLIIAPKSRSGTEVGQIPISNYGLEIPITFSFEIDGNPSSLSLKLNRRTFDELKKFFGPEGVPPYPWYANKENGG